MAKFDPTKDHGIVTGAGAARFFQDGLYFDALGNELPGQAKPAKTGKAKSEAPASASPETPAVDQVAQQLTEEFKE